MTTEGTKSLLAVALAAASAAIVVGCSSVSDNATVTVDGTLQRSDGAPAAATKVTLLRVPDPLELLTEGITFVASLGTVCLEQSPPPICKTLQTTTTDGSGAYHYMMKGTDVKGAVGEISPFVLSATEAGDAKSAYVEADFGINVTALVVPTVKFWDPATLTIAPGPLAIDATWEDFKASHGAGADGYRVLFYDGDGTEVWEQDAAGGHYSAAIAEDITGTAAIAALTKGSMSSTDFSFTFRSPRVAFQGAADQPASRSKGCSVADGTSEKALAPCPFTDGKFAGAFPSQSCPSGQSSCAANSFVTLDLGHVAPVGQVLLHNFAASGTQGVIELATDGKSFTQAATFTVARFLVVPLPAGATAQQVRVRLLVPANSKTTPAITSLGELSVYPTAF